MDVNQRWMFNTGVFKMEMSDYTGVFQRTHGLTVEEDCHKV